MRKSNTHHHQLVTVVGVALTLVMLLVASPADAKKKQKAIEKYAANALVLSTPGMGGSSTLNVSIYRWSTDEENDQLEQAIKAASSDRTPQRAVPKALRQQDKVGYLHITGEGGYPIRYTAEEQVGDKRRIYMATDRPVTFSEVYAGSYVRDFDVTVIIFQVDADGKGEGVASIGAEVKWDDQHDELSITDFSAQPVKLTNVRPQK